jgi:hypothetical protein
MCATKIILHSNFCDLDDFRDSDGALSITLSKDANIAIAKKVSELSNLENIISDFTTSFELTLTNRELAMLSRIEFTVSNTGRLVYRATLDADIPTLIDGNLYIDKTSERISDGYVTYSVQLIGTHQTWKEYLKSITLKDLDLGSVTWKVPDITNLWQNNDRYVDNQDIIYPLLANFGRWFGTNEANLYDIRFIVYKLAILQAMFCKAGYKIKSSFLNSDYFRGQAAYLLETNFGVNQSIVSGSDVRLELSADTTPVVPGYLIPFDIVIQDNGGKWDIPNSKLVNNTNKNLYEVFIDIDLTICNPNPIGTATSAGALAILDAANVTVWNPTFGGFPPSLYIFPEMDRSGVTGGTTPLNPLECETYTFTVNLSQLLRDYLVNDGYIEPNWQIFFSHIISVGGVPYVVAGAKLRYYTQTPNHFNEGDIIDIAGVLNSEFSCYDLLVDEKQMYNLRFKTIQSEKIVEIEPEPPRYQTYKTLYAPSVNTKGFLGNPSWYKDIIDITPYIDVCQFIDKVFPQQQRPSYFFFKFADSNDKYARYAQFQNDNNPLFSNNAASGLIGVDIKEVKLKLYQPTLNDGDFEICNVGFKSTYIPFMWENARADADTENPEQGTNLGVRTFCVFGWSTQVSAGGASFTAIGFKFEGTTYQFVPNTGQIFEVPIVKSLTTFGIPDENNVYKDNLTAFRNTLTKNLVNTFFQFGIDQQDNAIEFAIKVNVSNQFFYEMDVRKIVRIFSEQSAMMRFNGLYEWLSITKQIEGNDLAILTLKPILPCK